ncbi:MULTISPECIES: GNAT family N-acetyltransferase [unclassified Rossellomorea]|uniref:GNAT family N-acetyltransferase n=1 Tax=unclassified Rossellomorea TaxID=2837526 RepID=UPI00261003BC|nr:GNAT family N-acetyltransferase [uncultured Rossellomorea sp.]
MEINIYHKFDSNKLDEICEVYQSAGWLKHSNEVITKVFQRSDIVSFAISDGRIIGVGRALTDGVFNAAIYDVVVHLEYQKIGIGSLIMSDLLEQLKDVSCVQLISTTGNEEFYRKHGMKKLKTGMARYLNSSLTGEYLD